MATVLAKGCVKARDCSLLFLGKANDEHTERAADFCRRSFTTVGVYLGKWGDPFPDEIRSSAWDCIISYLSRWIVPQEVLKRAKLAVNFHPGPPEYPGYGCNNFAIFEDAKDYGVTCHHMHQSVDSGPIIAVRRFTVLATDNGGTLLLKAYDHQLALFCEIAGLIVQGKELPRSDATWTRKPFTRQQFNELGKITVDMSEIEAARRRRAVNVDALKPYAESRGKK